MVLKELGRIESNVWRWSPAKLPSSNCFHQTHTHTPSNLKNQSSIHHKKGEGMVIFLGVKTFISTIC